jgi:hypothetical protein
MQDMQRKTLWIAIVSGESEEIYFKVYFQRSDIFPEMET